MIIRADMRLKCQVQADVLTVAYRLQGKYRGLWILQKCALQVSKKNYLIECKLNCSYRYDIIY